MKYPDVEIYLNQFVSFFEKNPNDLLNLIGDIHKEIFLEKGRLITSNKVTTYH